MKIKKIKVIDYEYGDERRIQKILYSSKEPIVLKIKNFTDKFTFDYFVERIGANTYAAYDVFENDKRVSHHVADFATVIDQIKKNMPHRIFGQYLTKEQMDDIEYYVPLWKKIPFRPRFFNKGIKIVLFFGGKGSHTAIHFDREHCCNLHLCMSGKKQLLLFTEDQNDNVYKEPFIGDSVIDFSQPLDELSKQFPRLNQAEAYDVTLEKGDLLFMPKNCWHYTKYLDASASATYVFYPKKILQLYGYFTGYFFIGYKAPSGFNISTWPLFQEFTKGYALASGKKKYVYKIVENILYIFMLPICSIATVISYKLQARKNRKKIY